MDASRHQPLPPPETRIPGEAAPPLGEFVSLSARVVNGTFGGGSTILGVFQRELVERRGWLTAEQYGLCFAVARITPGTSIGQRVRLCGARQLAQPLGFSAAVGALEELGVGGRVEHG